jgi:HlyD family secretion protein
MAGEHRNIFREKSLERLSSPERLDQLLQLIDRRSWLPLVALGALVGILVLWAIFGRVPVNVYGEGILIHPRTVVEIQAPGSGQLTRIDVRVGDVVRPGQTLATIALPELEKQLELEREKARELTALGRAGDILRPSGASGGNGTDGLEDHIDESRGVARNLRREARQSIADERRILEEQRERAEDLSVALEKRWQSLREMFETGFASEKEVLEAEAEFIDSRTRVSDLETRLLELKTRQLEIDDRYLSRLQGLADLRMDLQDYEQQIADVDREIARLETRLDEEGRITSEKRGTILEIHVAPGQFVTTGAHIGAMSVGDPTTPLASVVYFQVGDGKRIDVGDRIQVTPDTVERERYGGIEGVVRAVSGLPVTIDEATNQIGNREIAEAIVGAGYRIQLLAELRADPSTPTGLAWSSSGGPEMVISAGTTTTARVRVEERRPIAFVLPALKSTAGVD